MRRTLSLVLGGFLVASPLSADQKPGVEKANSTPPQSSAKAAKLPTVDDLKSQLKDPKATVRRMAAQQLGAMRVQAFDAVPALIQALGDPEPKVRATVAEAIGGIGITAKAAVGPLLKLLKDPDALVRETAAEALADIGADAPKVVPALLAMFDDPDMNVRCAAAKSLGDFRAAALDAVPALKKLRRNDKHPLVREAADEALQTIQKALQKLGS